MALRTMRYTQFGGEKEIRQREKMSKVSCVVVGMKFGSPGVTKCSLVKLYCHIRGTCFIVCDYPDEEDGIFFRNVNTY